ncbi:MAG: amino acid adenylation domain-containing protein, partial [Chloroflexota bacterium]
MRNFTEHLTQEPNLDRWLQQLIQQGIEPWVEEGKLRIRAPKGVLTPDLRRQLTARKTELVSRLQRSTQENSPQFTITPAPEERHEPFPLTDIQHAYWVGSSTALELGGVGIHYYVETICEDLSLPAFEQALNLLIKRHDMLRAIILPDGQQQILAQVPTYQMTVKDYRADSYKDLSNYDQAVESQRTAWRAEMSHQNLPTDQWPPFDIRAMVLKNGQVCLYFSLNLLSLDAGSILILFREWFELYQTINQGRPLLSQQPLSQQPLSQPPLSFSFRDYVLAEKRMAESSLYGKARTYWLDRLDSLFPAPELPMAQTSNMLASPRFKRHQFQLPSHQWGQLKTQAEKLGVTPTSVLLAVFSRVLATWAKSPSFTLNLTFFQRQPFHPEVDQLVGDFTQLNLFSIDTATQADIDGGDSPHTTSIRLLAQQIQRQLWQDLDHHQFSGVEVLRELSRLYGQTTMPIVFTSALGLPQENPNIFPFGEPLYELTQTPQVTLDHVVFERAGRLCIHWDVMEDLFPSGLIETMFEANCALLTRLAEDETCWQQEKLPLLPASQLAQLTAYNATEQSLLSPDAPNLLHTLFWHQVADHAAQPAILTRDRAITYAELAQRAAQVGRWLQERGAKPNTLVAVVMEKGWEQVVAVLGIHFAGAAYLPIDPTLPAERQAYLLEQGEVQLALTQSWLDTTLTWPSQLADRLCVDTCAVTPNDAPNNAPNDTSAIEYPEVLNQPTDIAYVIYTSGSTGQPKGVVIDHRGAVNTVLDVNQRYGITASDRAIAISALNFDLSVYDIFGLLAVGGAIVMPEEAERIDPQHWHELVEQHGVTVWNTVPALMQMYVEYEELKSGKVEELKDGSGNEDSSASSTLQPFNPSTLRIIMMSGDWIPVSLPDRIQTLHPDADVYSMGGATEASIWSIYYPIDEVDPTWPSIPYGRPMANQTFYVLNAQLEPCPMWVPGDLYIGGIGLALGYWKDDAKTNERFIVHPETGDRLYKTGDLGRYLPSPNGLSSDTPPNIEFMGRDDFQVKIRGHRIELGEIETTLLQHSSVQEVLVSVAGDAKSPNKQLVAYVVHHANMESQDSASSTSGNAVQAMPDQYGVEDETQPSMGNVLTDPIERLEFKLRQPGVRHDDNILDDASLDIDKGVVDMPQPIEDDTLRRTYLARQSYRQFQDTPLALNQFSTLLSTLRQLSLAESPLPKYRYPSAGSLYPVQTYVYIKPDRIQGLAGG